VVETDPSTETVGSLKHRIAERSGLPPCEQRLCFGTRQLRDGATLAECGVGRDDTLRVHMRLLGGTAYMCGDCGAMNDIKARDPIRCRVCGYRIMYKVCCMPRAPALRNGDRAPTREERLRCVGLRRRGRPAPAAAQRARPHPVCVVRLCRPVPGANEEPDPVRGPVSDRSELRARSRDGVPAAGGEGWSAPGRSRGGCRAHRFTVVMPVARPRWRRTVDGASKAARS